MIDLKALRELTKKLKVLYVEDDTSIAESMITYLKKFFYTTSSAQNGLIGLELYKNNEFDIVITDLSMPKMSGLDMIKEIKKINAQQTVLITSAHSAAEYIFGAIKLGVDGYIIKPYDYTQLNNELFKIAEKLNIYKENEKYKNDLQDMVKQKTQELNDNYEKTLYSMVELIERRDTYTAGHSKRVANYSKLIAENMGYSEDECTMIYQAGILHDIGKIETPDAVLLNPKRLNEIEYKLIQEHVVVGYNLVKNIPMFKHLANIIYAHHERYDGLGYPNGLKKDEISPLSRIMIVADAFDSMTTNRIYKSRKSLDDALEELRLFSSKQFHPEVVQSALVVLKDITIDNSINQLPKTRLEEEKFAYFYNDTLTTAYNQNYLEVVLMKNSYEFIYKYLDIFYINNFSKYNKDNGWKKGDIFLQEFENILETYFKSGLIFRVFGDDFIIISKNKIDTKKAIIDLDALVRNNYLEYKMKSINLTTKNIKDITDIEEI